VQTTALCTHPLLEGTVKERSCWSVWVSVFPWNQLNQDFKIRYIPALIELGEDSLMPHLRLLTVCWQPLRNVDFVGPIRSVGPSSGSSDLRIQISQ